MNSPRNSACCLTWVLLGIAHGVCGSILVDDAVLGARGRAGGYSDDQASDSGNAEVMFGTPVENPTIQDPNMLHDGTVSGSPCKSIFEILIQEQLDTARAALQVGLGTNFSMLIHPGAELTLLAPSEAAFQRLGFNSSVLPVAEMATQMSKTWVLQRPVNVALSTDSDMLALSLLGHNVTFRAAATGTEVIAKGAVASIAQANLPACKSWVHILDGVLGL